MATCVMATCVLCLIYLHLLIDSCSEDSGKKVPYLEMVNGSRDEPGTV